MNSLELSSMSDEELASLDLENKTFGVIGVCGVVGNLVARILMDRGAILLLEQISHLKRIADSTLLLKAMTLKYSLEAILKNSLGKSIS